ncbi:MAG TPA: ABC transporter permease [Gemmatimonadaceae bacterium]|jgi:predicted permease
MSVLERLPHGIRRIFRLPETPARLMHELDDEIQFHLETRIDALRASGLSEHDARVAALARFGDADDVRRHYRGMSEPRLWWRGAAEWWAEWMQDVRFALRQFARAPGFTTITVVTLALGIGANTALFSVVHHLILASPPFPDGNRIVSLTATSGGGRIHIEATQHMAEAWRQGSHIVDQIAFAQEGELLLGDSASGSSEDIGAMALEPQIFSIAPVHPIIGRNIVGADTLAGAPPVIVLGYDLWVREFGRDSTIVGRLMRLSNRSYTIVGVMPPGYSVPFAGDMSDVFTALETSHDNRPIVAIGKLRRGTQQDQANRELATLLPPHSVVNAGDEPPRVMTAADITSKGTRTIVLVLFATVCCVLLIACANVANLALARSWSRQREFAIRAALGAGRRRLSRQVFTESMLLALAGGVAGIAVALVVLRIVAAAQPAGLGYLDGVHIESPAIAWTLGISILAAVVSGVAPALFAADARFGETLKAGSRTASGSVGGRRFRSTLIVVEVSLSVVLLVAAGLLIRTLTAFEHLDIGMQSHGLVGVQLQMPPEKKPDPVRRRASMDAMLSAVRAIPGVQGATYAAALPPKFGLAFGRFEIEGRQFAPGDTLSALGFDAVTPDFFALAGISVVRGRVFAADAPDDSSQSEIVINEKLAHRYWPDGNAIGARLRQNAGPWSTVVGIVGDVRLPALDQAGRDVQMYIPNNYHSSTMQLLVRSTLPLAALDKALLATIHNASGSVIVRGDPQSAEAIVSRSMANQRFVLTLLGAFAVLALVLASIGLHGVVAYSAGQRTREIGVRIALGAQSGDVVKLVLAQGLSLVAIGVVVGAAVAAASSRGLGSLLYHVRPGDPMTIAVAALLLFAVAVIASYGPARRAAALDPIDALRAD